MPDPVPGQHYFTVTCKNCEQDFAFGDAPSSGDVELPDVPLQLACNHCGQQFSYSPSEIEIRRFEPDKH